jgi:hypothetical protein
MTFDVTAQVFRSQSYGWQNIQEAFCVCRHCDKPTIFVVETSLEGRKHDIKLSEAFSYSPDSIVKFDGSLNQFYKVKGYINLKDFSCIAPPDHLQPHIEAAFKEGAACYAIGCYNAASCMFRLCLDLLSKPLLPNPKDAEINQPTDFVRRNLGPRLAWLFKEGLLPKDLEHLATSVKDDGNDGAHAGNLTKEDCDDLIDFTTVFLERLVTEPKKLEIAEARRAARRGVTQAS